ncbi:TatD family hydrolase [Brachybacterium tyrofermentans]|uniref:TatD family hydrolase n=1 Tax=Brachybacterium tyrofermentans TaxID=47848 RepID=UPI003FD555EB
MIGSALPALDTHAHIAPDVTSKQIAALGQSVTFAMTRSVQEARQVKSRRDPALVWGIGVHPGVAAARDGWNAKQFTELLGSFALVGEIGLDRRGGDLARQRSIFRELLNVVKSEPLLVSIHSTGATSEVVEYLHNADMRGAILHWFNGNSDDISGALETDAYFSVNAAMSEDQLRLLPPERVLTETDFPARKVRARKPADTQRIEQLLSQVWGQTPEEVRARVWWNLRTLCERSGAIERLPEPIADTLLYL